MNFTDLKEFTYINKNVIVNGNSIPLDITLSDDIEALQYHKGRDFIIEELKDGGVRKVPLSENKYNFVLDEYIKQKDILDNPPPIIYTAKELQNKQITTLNKSCEDYITGGFISAALGSIHYYQSSRDDQANLVSDVLADIDLDIRCSADNENYEFITHTALEVKKVSDDFTLFRIEALKKVNDLKELVNNATTKEDIESIVW
jgi:hypothetical protein